MNKSQLISVWRQPKYRYIFVGGSVFVFELACIAIGQAAGLSSVSAVALAFWLALFVSFGMQKLVAFQDRRVSLQIISWQFAAYTGLVLFNFGFTILATYALQSLLPAAICRTFALAITTIWNYYLYKTRIFKTPSADVA